MGAQFGKALAALSIACAALVIGSASAQAARVTWTGAARDGLWDNEANWIDDTGIQRLPAAGDDTFISRAAVSYANAQGNDGMPYSIHDLTLSGGASVTFTSGPESLHITGSITLNDTSLIKIGAGSLAGSLHFPATAVPTIGGTGRILFGSSPSNRLDSAANLIIGPGVTVAGASGSIIVTAPGRLINQGTISESVAGGSFFVYGGNHWENWGLLQVSNGSLNLAGNYWTNAGTIRAIGGTLNVGGTFKMQEAFGGAFARSPGSTINLAGILDNMGRVTTFDSRLRSWNLYGSIQGGTIQATPGNSLVVVRGNWVDLAIDGGGGNPSPIDMRTKGGIVYLSGDLQLNNGATLYLGNATGSTTGNLLNWYTGTGFNITTNSSGRIVMGKSLYNQIRLYASVPDPRINLVIGRGVTVEGTGYLWSMNGVINNGTISLTGVVAAGYLQKVVNNGIINVAGVGATGVLTVGGDYTQTSAGILNIEIRSTAAFDQISISGAATLGGTLNAKLLGSAPSRGSIFKVLSSASRIGTFAVAKLPPFFVTQYSPTGLILANP